MPSAEPKGLPTIPVYQWWLRINLSKHQGVFPSLGGLEDRQAFHIEGSAVRGLVGLYQKFSTKSINDGQHVALQGHDVGPLVNHCSVPPDNTLLPLTAAKAKCKWLFTGSRYKIEGESPCLFMPLIVPYIYCHERKQKTVVDANGAESTKVTFIRQLPGMGLLMIPTSSETVTWRLGFWDYVLGITRVLADTAFDYVWSRYDKVGSGLQRTAAKRVSAKDVPRMYLNAAFKMAGKEYTKGLVSGGDVKLPFKLAKLDLNTGKVSIFDHGVGDVGWKMSDSAPFDYRGWNPLLEEPRPPNPVLDELLHGVFHAG